MYFILNIVASCCYPTEIVWNNMERIAFIIVIYFGMAFFAFGFTAMSEISNTVSEVYQKLFRDIRLIFFNLG